MRNQARAMSAFRARGLSRRLVGWNDLVTGSTKLVQDYPSVVIVGWNRLSLVSVLPRQAQRTFHKGHQAIVVHLAFLTGWLVHFAPLFLSTSYPFVFESAKASSRECESWITSGDGTVNKFELKNCQPNYTAQAPAERLWLEVKNCHLSRTKGLAEFPDCKAERSTRHLGDLAAQVAQGDRAAVLFVVQREDCDEFSACADLDPAFAKALDQAAQAGVEVLVYACEMGTEGIRLSRKITWRN